MVEISEYNECKIPYLWCDCPNVCVCVWLCAFAIPFFLSFILISIVCSFFFTWILNSQFGIRINAFDIAFIFGAENDSGDTSMCLHIIIFAFYNFNGNGWLCSVHGPWSTDAWMRWYKRSCSRSTFTAHIVEQIFKIEFYHITNIHMCVRVCSAKSCAMCNMKTLNVIDSLALATNINQAKKIWSNIEYQPTSKALKHKYIFEWQDAKRE